MQPINALEYYHTSVTLRARSVRRVRAVRKLLSRAGIEFSESRVFDELLRLYLRLWRGNGPKPATLRRYNTDGHAYRIRPFYINRVLHAVAAQRAMHSGESLSRMLDFAIRRYSQRLLEDSMSSSRFLSLADRNRWSERYRLRRHREAFFISYVCKTQTNLAASLMLHQQSSLILKKGLSPAEIFVCMKNSA